MKRKQAFIFKFILMLILLSGCANPQLSSDAEKVFNNMYQNCRMNEALRLTHVGKTFNGEKNTNFNLEPISNTSIIFPAGFNLRILYFDTNKNTWVDIKNNITYLPADIKYRLGTNDPEKEQGFLFFGIMPSLDKNATLRVVVHGNMYLNDIETDQCAGAFTDFEFVP